MFRIDICIAGAGIIGLSLALELHARGLVVAVLEARHSPLQEASTAAAGMLAANDPDNPSELRALADLSLSLYPAFLDSLSALGGIYVPFQTTHTLQSSTSWVPLSPPVSSLLIDNDCSAAQSLPGGLHLLQEHSLDPRQLASAMLAAIVASPVRLFTDSPVLSTRSTNRSVEIATASKIIEAAHFVDCTGAWANDFSNIAISSVAPSYKAVPIKGQMLAVALPAAFPLKVTVRTSDLYIVPRTMGPNAGRAIIGATIEDVGFDKTVNASQIEGLRQAAVAVLPQLAVAEVLESWAGLRPATANRLPLLGAHPDKPRHWVASGHYRNGILLAPATARVMTQLLLDQVPSTSLAEFDLARQSVQLSLGT